MDKTIIFCTENKCPEPIFSSAIHDLSKKSEDLGLPIISVSHKPIDLGKNICIGEHRRSWVMLYRQLLIGCKKAKTKYIGIAEHDCFYCEEHLQYIPQSDEKFFYNENVWLVSYDKERHPDKLGMYSRFWTTRYALSQMICNRELYIDALEKRLALIKINKRSVKEIDHMTEPGHSKVSKKRLKLLERANNGSSAYLRPLLPDFIELERAETFSLKIANLDVRHGGNFTGPRRGRERRYKIKYWGKFEDLINKKTDREHNE